MTGPLDGVLVVDLTRALAGPHAAMMLGDLGARVIKVESPGSGDDTRGWGPPFVQPDGGDRESTYFLSTNKNKESITLDLKDDADKAVLTELLRRADVLLENFRPGTLARLGFGTDVLAELNPRLVTLAISGFGHDGPEGGRAGYDQIAQGEGGLMSLTGSGPDDPQRVGVPIGDLLAGMYGAYGVLAALLERERTGRGQVVRTSLLAAIVGVHAFQGTAWTVAGKVGRAQGNHHPSIAPYGLFHCAGGSVQVACANESLWRRLCAEFGFDPEAPGHGDQRRPRGAPRRGDRAARGRVRRHPRRGPAGPAREGRHPVGQGPHASTRSTAGTRRSRRACSSTSSTPRWAGCRCPGRRCGSSTPVRTARPRRPGASTPLPRCSAPTATRSAPGCSRRRRPADGDDVEDGHAT